MLELHLKNPNDLQLREIDSVGVPPDGHVKIKLIYGGICGSDLRVFQGSLPHASYPLRPGHELVGTIIEVGKDAPFNIGTRVVVFPNSFCGECDLCKKGKTNICRQKRSIGVNIDGGFAEEIIISSKYVLPIPKDMPDERAVLIEPFAVVVHALEKATITKGTAVAIVGSGNEGMLAAVLGLYLGARITAIDINPVKREMVKKLGDIRAIHPEEVGDETFDIVIEAAGAQKAVEQAVHLVRPGGELILIGMTPKALLPIMHIVRNEITLYGSMIYSFPTGFEHSIKYLSDKNLNVDPIISKILPFTEFKQAYEIAIAGSHGKVVLDFKEKGLIPNSNTNESALHASNQ
ncbi:zinc-binding dehydrogenase [Peribacillus simplex]|uniref:zinc-dependent alcohol dehydrogenase n=1 Tax=Peribacillus simplex TaxID=1478 RepID=UPI00381D8F3E